MSHDLRDVFLVVFVFEVTAAKSTFNVLLFGVQYTKEKIKVKPVRRGENVNVKVLGQSADQSDKPRVKKIIKNSYWWHPGRSFAI